MNGSCSNSHNANSSATKGTIGAAWANGQGATLTRDGHEILFPPLPYDIHTRADRATSSSQLQQFLNKATYTKDQNRQKVWSEVFGANQDAIRDLAAQIKQHTLDHLDYYLERFTDRATTASAQVHFATTAEQANAICIDIARRHGCRLCVKSKTMVTEETQLLPALQNAGIETIETDLGEFILQLDHDAPSHIVTPMIHKDRAAVARAFERELGVPYTEDANQLTRIARDYLREKFRRSDLGITGANFLVAETGSIAICTNEGNGRLCTSVPPVHVVFAGIEKLVPSLEHLGVLLKLLARSSTGQPLTVYTHIITGPARPAEHDKPVHLHIILVDNGRSQILAKETRALLRCIRCGACLNACPVFRKIGGHSYGAVYSGPIGSLITPLLRGLSNYPDLPHASSLCGACYEACPVKIDIPKYLIQLREQMVSGGIAKLSDRIFYRLWGLMLRDPLMYRLGGWLQTAMLRWLAKRNGTLAVRRPSESYVAHGWVGRLWGPLRGWTGERDMLTPPARSFRHWWQHGRTEEDRCNNSVACPGNETS